MLMHCLGDARIDITLKTRLITALEMPAIERLAQDWKSWPIRIRQEMVEWLLRTPERSGRLAEWLKADRISREELSMDQIARFRRLRSEESKSLFGPVVDRQEIVRQRLGALELMGNAAVGERHFRQRCLVCHQHGTDGNLVGPERKTFRNLGKPILLVNVLDPSREVAGAYQLVTLQTKTGETHAGLLMSENNREVRLRTALGQDLALPRDAISSMTPSQRSLMPDGLESGLTDQDLADLLEFLVQP
jgi:putative heme-binding domain-containing protein